MGFNLKNYEEVKDRISRFYEKFPEGRITTELHRISDDNQTVFFKSSVFRDIEEQAIQMPLATGHAFEIATEKGVNATSHVENCETSAIGRALANAAFIKDRSRPSAEEMKKVERHNKLNDTGGSDLWPLARRMNIRKSIAHMPASDLRKQKVDEMVLYGPIQVWPDEVCQELETWYEANKLIESENPKED